MRTVAGLNINLPDELHRRAKSEAALRGQTLTDFVIDAIARALDDPPNKGARR